MSAPINNSLFDFLAARRSVKPDKLTDPAPTADELNRILTAGTRVPDHKKLAPWRFIVFEGDARARMGVVFADACLREEKEPPSAVRLEFERGRFTRAPMVITAISSPKPNPGAPEWEQIMSAGAMCFNTCLAANALGFGTCWITEWIAYSPIVRATLKLSEHERIAGFIYIGHTAEKPQERERPAVADLVTRWGA